MTSVDGLRAPRAGRWTAPDHPARVAGVTAARGPITAVVGLMTVIVNMAGSR